MTPERREEIGDVFAAALEEPTAARARFLDQRCRGDVELRREVELLLEAHALDDGVLDRPLGI